MIATHSKCFLDPWVHSLLPHKLRSRLNTSLGVFVSAAPRRCICLCLVDSGRVEMAEKRVISEDEEMDNSESQDEETSDLPNVYERYRNAIVARNMAYLQPALQASEAL